MVRGVSNAQMIFHRAHRVESKTKQINEIKLYWKKFSNMSIFIVNLNIFTCTIGIFDAHILLNKNFINIALVFCSWNHFIEFRNTATASVHSKNDSHSWWTLNSIYPLFSVTFDFYQFNFHCTTVFGHFCPLCVQEHLAV